MNYNTIAKEILALKGGRLSTSGQNGELGEDYNKEWLDYVLHKEERMELAVISY
jgi:hypothetical protein